MKKLILSAVAIAMISLFSGCTKEYITEVHEHAGNTYVTGSEMFCTEYTVTANDWVGEDGVNYYYASYQNPDITDDVVDNGVVLAYVWDNGRWNLLPYVYPYYSAAEDNTWGENLRFDWSSNEVTFILQDLDGGMPEDIDNISDMTFKVAVIRN